MIGRVWPCQVAKIAAGAGRVRVFLITSPEMRGKVSVAFDPGPSAFELNAGGGLNGGHMRRAFWTLTLWCAASIPKDALMRIPVAILTTATVLTAAPVRAQTYDPNYPVCLQTYGIGGGYIECGYTSLAQCVQSASGIAAQCISNPYFASPQVPAGPHYRRHRLVY